MVVLPSHELTKKTNEGEDVGRDHRYEASLAGKKG
jgi:hypothetical protein